MEGIVGILVIQVLMLANFIAYAIMVMSYLLVLLRVFFTKRMDVTAGILVSRDLLRENLRRLLYKVTSYLLKRAKDCIILRMVVVLGTVANLTLFPSLFVIGE